MKKLFALLLLIISINAFAFTGIVTQVHDGDTLTVINEIGHLEKIRIYRLDTPEMKSSKWAYQPYANEARNSLISLCKGEHATVIRKGVSYNRTVGQVTCKNSDVADYQISNGQGWVYKYTATKALKSKQETARLAKLGLWGYDNPIEPLVWRKGLK